MHAKKTAVLALASAFAAFLFVLAPVTSSAQWQQTYTFPSQIHVLYFLNNQGSPSTGFAGLVDGEIWRTNDNAQTWKRVNTPSEYGSITAFAFKDGSQGWCSIRPFIATQSSCWSTTDGGLNWQALSPAGSSVNVSYNAVSQLLFLVNWRGGSQFSSDLGQTWNIFAPTNENGISWADAAHGIMSTLTGTFSRTSDAGQSWQNSASMNVECWSPLGIPGTTTFLAAGEKTHTIYRSSDYGASWSPAFLFNPSVNLIGDIEGTTAFLYVQTTGNGFYASTDLGNSWQSICGPSNDRDTRFYVKGSEIFAGTPTGGLWYLPNATAGGVAPNPLSMQRSKINFTNTGCFALDSVLRLSYSGSCPLSFTRVQLSGSSSFRLGNISNLPRTILGNDSLRVIYAPTKSGMDTAQLLVEYFINYVRYDTIINLYAVTTRTFNYVQNLTHWYPLLNSSCETRDTSVQIKNRACDTLFITAADLGDSTAFQLGNLQLPLSILPGDSSRIYLHCEHHKPGDFATQLHLHLLSGSQQRDTLLPLEVIIPATAKPTLGSLSAILATKCATLDTIVTIRNLFCDSITLKSATLSDGSFFSITNSATPKKLGTNDSVNIKLHILTNGKGTRTTELLLEFVSNGVTLDTSIMLTATTANNIPIVAALSSDRVSFGSVSICNAKQLGLQIGNLQCRDLIITKISIPDPDSLFQRTSLALPDTLVPGAFDSLLLFFHPHHAGPASAYITVTLSADGIEKDTLIELTGAGYETVSAEFEPAVLDLGSISTCESATRGALLVNHSCDSIFVTEVRIDADSKFDLLPAKLPRWIHRGDSLSLGVSIASKKVGKFEDSIEVRMRPGSASAPEVARILPLRALVTNAGSRISVVPASFIVDSISPCFSQDTEIVLTNRSQCDSISIVSIDQSGDSAIDYLAALPIKLAPGASTTITINLHPKPGSTTLTYLHLGGTATDTLVAFKLSARQPDRTFNVIAKETTYSARPCEIVRHQYTITSTGCQSVSIDSLSLTSRGPLMRFAFDSTVALPFALLPGKSKTVYVLYDVNQLGDSIATLNIQSGVGQRSSIGLVGVTIGKIARAQLDIVAGDRTNTENVRVSDVARASLIFRTAVPVAVGLAAVQCRISYDRDVLQLAKIDATSGWSVIDTSSIGPGSYSLTLASKQPSAFAAGDELAALAFTTTVAKSPNSSIKLRNLRFNYGDSLFANCMLAADAPHDLLMVTLDNACGDSLIRVALSNEPIIVERVTQNPVYQAPAYVEVDLLAQHATKVKVSIVDAGGVTRRTWEERQLESGRTKLLLDVDGLANGLYFLTLESPYQTVVRKVIIAR